MIRRYFKSHFVRNVITLLTGTTLAQLIPIVASPLLTRIYNPKDFGLFALYMALVSVLSIIATGRFELAILLPQKENDSYHVAILSVFLTILTSIIFLILILLFGSELANMLNEPQIRDWLYLVPISVLIIGLYQSLNYWMNRQKRFTTLAKNRVLTSSATVTGQLTIGHYYTPAGLLWGQIIGQLISLIYLFRKCSRVERSFTLKIDCKRLIKLFKKYSNFPKLDVPTSLVNVLSSQAPNIFLTSFFSAGVAGFYYLTQRVLQAPITLISGSVLDVFKQRASEDYRTENNCKRIFIKTLIVLTLISVPIGGILFASIESVFLIAFGEQWRASGEYAQILIPSLVLRTIANPLSFMFYIAEKQALNLMGMFALFVFIISSMFFADTPKEAVLFISLSYSLIYLWYIIASAKLAKVI